MLAAAPFRWISFALHPELSQLFLIVGAMLPCNVILREVDGGIEISAIDPVASMQAIENTELHAVAGQVRDMLAEALEAI